MTQHDWETRILQAVEDSRDELLELAGDRVDQRAALGDLQSGLDGGGDGRIDGERHVDQLLDDL